MRIVAILVGCCALGCGDATPNPAPAVDGCGWPEDTTGTEQFPVLVSPNSCLPRQLEITSQYALCNGWVVEVVPTTECDCVDPGRGIADPKVVEAVLSDMQRIGRCDAPDAPDCDAMRVCALQPIAGDLGDPCLSRLDAPGVGYCYLDAEQDRDGDGAATCAAGSSADCIGSPELLAALGCEEPRRRYLRILGLDPAATVYAAVQGAPCLDPLP